MPPNVYWDLTYGEAIDWLMAAITRHKQNIQMMKYQAWFMGLAFNRAYVAARDENQPYPHFSEMFPGDTKWTPKGAYAAERAELGMILNANKDKKAR